MRSCYFLCSRNTKRRMQQEKRAAAAAAAAAVPQQPQPAPPPPPAVAMPSVVTAPPPTAKVPSLLTMSIPPPVQYAATPSYGAAVLPSFRLVVDPLTGQCTFQPDISAPVAYQPSYPAPTGLVYPP